MKQSVGKVLITVIWIVIGINIMQPFPGWWATALLWLSIFFLVSHIVEYILFYKVISQKPESALLAFILTLLYGFLYWKDFPDKSGL
jgi:uncharacterized protein YhhL (DUF1145 family)